MHRPVWRPLSRGQPQISPNESDAEALPAERVACCKLDYCEAIRGSRYSRMYLEKNFFFFLIWR